MNFVSANGCAGLQDPMKSSEGWDALLASRHRLCEEFLLDLGANEREEYYWDQYSKATAGHCLVATAPHHAPYTPL